jgi:cellulose synthase/poly-beta-1,6-N-acetylglucosamine synthase-like glycosyltransferase
MVGVFAKIIISLYFITVILILGYTVSQFLLFLSYYFKKRKTFTFDAQYLPFVTIQLPIYNEKYVVEDLLRNIVEIDYPSEKLEIQVLDDSTDDSLALTEKLIMELRATGIDIKHIHRSNRVHFKAGALREGLNTAKGEFIAIFDADFLPQKDWLLKTVGYFISPRIGVVQARWQHTNRNFSILTRVQAMALDHHFSIEQQGRNTQNDFINFNGTAGIWRKKCILDAGNWEGDTLTEDLDLSYRAQIKKWQFVYLEELETPSELPVAMSAIRSQQFRWNKGGAENLVKNLPKVLKAKDLNLKTKVQAVAHLLNSSVFLWVFLLTLLSVPLSYAAQLEPKFSQILVVGTLLKVNIVMLGLVFYLTFRKFQSNKWRHIPNFIGQFLVFFPVILSLSFHNSMAVLEAYFGIKSDFVRTPKFNLKSNQSQWKSNQYLNKKIGLNVLIELFLAIFFAFGVFLDFKMENYTLMPFHGILVVGYLYIVIKSIND